MTRTATEAFVGAGSFATKLAWKYGVGCLSAPRSANFVKLIKLAVVQETDLDGFDWVEIILRACPFKGNAFPPTTSRVDLSDCPSYPHHLQVVPLADCGHSKPSPAGSALVTTTRLWQTAS